MNTSERYRERNSFRKRIREAFQFKTRVTLYYLRRKLLVIWRFTGGNS